MAKQKVSIASTGLDLDLGSGGMVLDWPNTHTENINMAAIAIRRCINWDSH
jgi:hypothetical protein